MVMYVRSQQNSSHYSKFSNTLFLSKLPGEGIGLKEDILGDQKPMEKDR